MKRNPVGPNLFLNQRMAVRVQHEVHLLPSHALAVAPDGPLRNYIRSTGAASPASARARALATMLLKGKTLET